MCKNIDEKQAQAIKNRERRIGVPTGGEILYTTTEAPVIAHHAKLGGLRLAPKGPAIHGGAPPIKEKERKRS